MASQMEQERSPLTPHTFGLTEDDSTAALTQSTRPQLAHVYTEKEDEDREKTSWLKENACGFIPKWTLILAVCVVALIAAICGGVIGAFLSRQHKINLAHLPPKATNSSTTAYASV